MHVTAGQQYDTGRNTLNCSLSHISREARCRKKQNAVHITATPGYVRDPVHFPTSGMRVPYSFQIRVSVNFHFIEKNYNSSNSDFL
jgi:hypothetical protein